LHFLHLLSRRLADTNHNGYEKFKPWIMPVLLIY
jgi:hypothetical protein